MGLFNDQFPEPHTVFSDMDPKSFTDYESAFGGESKLFFILTPDPRMHLFTPKEIQRAGVVDFSNKVIALGGFITAGGSCFVGEGEGIISIGYLVGERPLNPQTPADNSQITLIGSLLFRIFDGSVQAINFYHNTQRLILLERRQ